MFTSEDVDDAAEGGVSSIAEAFPAAAMLQDLDTLGAFTFHGVIESAKQQVR